MVIYDMKNESKEYVKEKKSAGGNYVVQIPVDSPHHAEFQGCQGYHRAFEILPVSD